MPGSGSAPAAPCRQAQPTDALPGLLTGLVILAVPRPDAVDAGPRLRATGPPAHLPARCIALAECYPLRFLPGCQGVHEIDRLALRKDWAQ